MQYFTVISACLASMAAPRVPCSHILMFDFICGGFCAICQSKKMVYSDWLQKQAKWLTGLPIMSSMSANSLQIYLCRPWIIWEICCKSLMSVKGQQACWFLQDFHLPLMVAFSHASMQWPFYLLFIPDCFQVSGRHSSWCRKCVLSSNNGATAASLENAGGLVER